MSLKKVLGIVLLNDGIIGFLLGLYRIVVDIVTPGRYTFMFPFSPHEIKYILFTVAALLLCVVAIVMLIKSKKSDN